ncbi:hypothetical protein ROS9278_00369 [Roseomonas sp. CECT 9278]|nr:hypothetical protein ROS9278_00369 [Roseomonas sp. CECT 9278]
MRPPDAPRRAMVRRGALLLGVMALARPAGALTPCPPGSRPGVLAYLRFALVLPNGDDVTEAQWRTFRSDIMDPVLRAPVTERDEPPVTQPRPQRFRNAIIEVRAAWSPDAPPPMPAPVLSVVRAWTARFPDAPVEARLVPACLGR